VTQPDRPGDFRSAAACGSVALFACLIVIYATPNDTVWTVDCGAKALLDDQKRESRALQQRIAKVEAPVAVTNCPALGQQLPELWHERSLLLCRPNGPG
jgi:hypothetical protein